MNLLKFGAPVQDNLNPKRDAIFQECSLWNCISLQKKHFIWGKQHKEIYGDFSLHNKKPIFTAFARGGEERRYMRWSHTLVPIESNSVPVLMTFGLPSNLPIKLRTICLALQTGTRKRNENTKFVQIGLKLPSFTHPQFYFPPAIEIQIRTETLMCASLFWFALNTRFEIVFSTKGQFTSVQMENWLVATCKSRWGNIHQESSNGSEET